jgi:uncharacterized protein YcfL
MKTVSLPTVLLLAALVACRSATKHDAVPEPPDPMLALPGDPDVESSLEALEVRSTGTAEARTLEFALRNKSSSTVHFAWAVEWFDRAGARIAGSARVWTPATLDAGATRTIQIPLPSPDAVSWRLRAVRPGSNTLTQGDSR